jgi:hypothetical protein
MLNAINRILTFFECIGRIVICFAPVVIFVSAMMWVQPWGWFT